MAKKKQKFSPEVKISILKQLLQKKQQISVLCEKNGCQPSSIYQWQETLFGKGHIVFESSRSVGRPTNKAKQDKHVKDLEQKLSNKNAIISELMEELLREKKLNGVI